MGDYTRDSFHEHMKPGNQRSSQEDRIFFLKKGLQKTKVSLYEQKQCIKQHREYMGRIDSKVLKVAVIVEMMTRQKPHSTSG